MMDYVIISGTCTPDWCSVDGSAFTTKSLVKMLVSVSTMDNFVPLVWIGNVHTWLQSTTHTGRRLYLVALVLV